MRLLSMLRWQAIAGMCALAGLCLAGVVRSPAQTRISPILAGIESRYNAVKTLQVEFTQVFRFGPRTESGTLFLRKPGKMRWDYADPVGKVFLSDGKFVYLFSPTTSIVERTPFRATDDLRAPLAFLLGKLDFQRDFKRFTMKPEKKNFWVTAEPKSEKSPYTMVSFLVSPSFEILEVEVAGMDQAVNRFRFRAEQRNPPIADSRFEFQPPSGARLVEAEQ